MNRHKINICAMLGVLASCDAMSVNPFVSGPLLPFDGEPHVVRSPISRLGWHAEGEVLSIVILPKRDGVAYLLRLDADRTDHGVIVDGGPLGVEFLHRVRSEGEVFLLLTPLFPGAEAVLRTGPDDWERLSRQTIVVQFDESFLRTAFLGPAPPGVADDENRQFLESIEPLVRTEVVARLQEMFRVYSQVVIIEDDEEQRRPYSILRYSGILREAASEGTFDSAAVAAGHADCPQRVQFGEAVPRGIDAGNRDPNDVAFVYVGSVRASRTPGCPPSLALDSTNNIANVLANIGAHEIGHLLGLGHDASFGIMSSAPRPGFQRQLGFGRSNLVVRSTGGFLNPSMDLVQDRVIQDPGVYFASIFDAP